MNKKRARVKWAVLAIFSGTIVLISPVLLFQGCKRSDQSASNDNTTATDTTLDTNTSAPPTLATTAATNDTNVPGGMTAVPAAPTPVAPTPAVAPAPAATTYVVVPHDTLGLIAKKFNVKLKDLEAANPDVVPTKLAVGKTLNIPASTMPATTVAGATDNGEDVYTVKAGDNLTKIAHSTGTTVKGLMALNNLKTTMIKVGDKLKLPARSTAASPTETMPAATTTASNPSSGMPVLR